MSWLAYALVSAAAASTTAILRGRSRRGRKSSADLQAEALLAHQPGPTLRSFVRHTPSRRARGQSARRPGVDTARRDAQAATVALDFALLLRDSIPAAEPPPILALGGDRDMPIPSLQPMMVFHGETP